MLRDDEGRGIHFPYSRLGRTRWELADGSPNDPFWASHIADLENHRPFKRFSYLVQVRSGRLVAVWTSGYPVFEIDKFVGYRGTGHFTNVEPWTKQLAG